MLVLKKKFIDESSVIIPAGNYHVVEVDNIDPQGVLTLGWISGKVI